MKSLALKFLGCTLLFLTFTAKAQMSSQNMKQLVGIQDATIKVLLYDDECKKCAKQRAANAQLMKAVNSFLMFTKNVEFIKETKENRKKLKDDKSDQYYLEMMTKSVEHKSGATVYYTYLHYLYLTKRPYKMGIIKAAKNGIVAGYRFGETTEKIDPDVIDLYPLAVKILNAYVQDAIEYKTLSPEIISNNNWRKCKIEKLQVYRGFFKQSELDDIDNQEKQFAIPIEFLGFNEILQKVYTQPVSDDKLKLIVIPNTDISSGKGSRGSFYYYFDLATGKMYFKQEIKGIKFRFFNKKDMEKIEATAKSKYKAPRK